MRTDSKRATNLAFSVREKFVDFLMLNKKSKTTYRFLLIQHQFVPTLYPSSSRFCSLRAISHIKLVIFSLIQLIFPLTPWENHSRLAGRFKCVTEYETGMKPVSGAYQQRTFLSPAGANSRNWNTIRGDSDKNRASSESE